MTTKTRIRPGIDTSTEGAEHVRGILADTALVRPGWMYVAGGMEDARSPFLLLAAPNGGRWFLLERRNDDGEWAPLFYPAPKDLDPADELAVLRAVTAVGAWDQETPVERIGFAHEEADGWNVQDAVHELLFEYRDAIAPAR